MSSSPHPPSAARPRRRWLRRLGWALGVVVTLPLVAAAGLGLYALTLKADLPDLYELRHPDLALSSVAYTADGVEIARYHRQHRMWVPFEDISPHVVRALIATEDVRFYRHRGVDYRRLLSSAYLTARGRQQGGSTVTMQLARNLFPAVGREATPTRKLREIMTARRLEKAYGKTEIVEMYLNTVPFGFNAYGIEAAAQVYFGKAAKGLQPAEAALLVGMLRATTGYNPVLNPEDARKRRNVVLALMATHGALPAAEAAHLQRQPLGLEFSTPDPTDSAAPHFAAFVRTWVEGWCQKNGCDVERDGLRIHTTLDSELQALAEDALARKAAALQAIADDEWSLSPRGVGLNTPADAARRSGAFGRFWRARRSTVTAWIKGTPRYRSLVATGVSPADALARLETDAAFADSLRLARTRLDAGLVAIEPQTGHVKAWVGGRDFGADAFDKVAQARRQPGSTFKPFVYAAAVDWGFRPDDPVEDRVQSYSLDEGRQQWTPTNAGGGASGATITLRDALVYSKNTVSAHLIHEVGPGYVARIARRMGIVSPMREVPSLALGTSEVTLLELAAAYGTFAQNGTRRLPVVVTRIESRDGTVLATFEPGAERALSGSTAYTVLDMMRGVVERGTGAAIRTTYGIAGDLAGKTGTTQEGADGWFVLVHPHLVTGAWVGFPDRSVTFRSSYWGQGGHNALHIVGDFFRQAQQGRFGLDADAAFEPPPGFLPPSPRESPWWMDDSLDVESNAYDALRTDTLYRPPSREAYREERGRAEPAPVLDAEPVRTKAPTPAPLQPAAPTAPPPKLPPARGGNGM